jgi:hypothetical protein
MASVWVCKGNDGAFFVAGDWLSAALEREDPLRPVNVPLALRVETGETGMGLRWARQGDWRLLAYGNREAPSRDLVVSTIKVFALLLEVAGEGEYHRECPFRARILYVSRADHAEPDGRLVVPPGSFAGGGGKAHRAIPGPRQRQGGQGRPARLFRADDGVSPRDENG